MSNEPNTAGRLLLMGSASMFLAVALGAFGAHGLKSLLPPEALSVYHTGNQYHFYHGLGLLAVALAGGVLPPTRLLRWSGAFMLTGLLLFSGSLYVLALTGLRWVGAVTPFGGVAFLVAWALLAAAAWRGWKC
jgi:uncharacterized membrane protein YgdD (TMEM256/DUF423 family)